MTEDEMIGWHHRLNAHEFEQTPGDGEGQGSLAGCSPPGHKELDMTEQLNSKSWDQRQTHLGTQAEWESSRFTPHCFSFSILFTLLPAVF